MAKNAKTTKKDPYQLLAEQAASKSGGSSSEYYKPQEGKTVVRLFPFEHDGQTFFSVTTRKHWLDDLKKMVSCEAGCPICELNEDLDEDSLRASTKYLFNAVVRDYEGSGEDKQVILEVGKKTLEQINTLAAATQAFDEKKGRDFTIVRSGKGMKTDYKVTAALKPTALGMKVKPVDLFGKLMKPLDEGAMDEIVDTLKEKYER